MKPCLVVNSGCANGKQNRRRAQARSAEPRETVYFTLREGQHEGLISIATYERIQRKLKEGVYAPTRKDTREDFALRGAVKCGCCGYHLTGGWCKGKRKKYPYYFCVNRDCEQKSKTISRDKLEGEFADLLGQLQPAPSLVKVATAMLTDCWNQRLMRAEEIAEGFKVQAQACEHQISELVDRIVEATNPRVIKAYEDKIAEAEKRKLVMLEKASQTAKPSMPLESLIEHALRYVSAPKTLWESGVLELRRLVLKLTFSSHLSYTKSGGIKHPEPTAPFKLFNHIKQIGEDFMNPHPEFAIAEGMVPLDGVDLNTLFDELAAIEDQLKPFKHELEELGL